MWAHKYRNLITPHNLCCKVNGTATSGSSILIEPILGPDCGRLCVDTSKDRSLQTPTYFSLWEDPVACSLGRGEERNIKTPGPWGKHQSAPFVLLWENYESDSQTDAHVHSRRERELRDSLTQKLYFKTHLDGSMAVPHAHALPSSESGSPSPWLSGPTCPGWGQQRGGKWRRQSPVILKWPSCAVPHSHFLFSPFFPPPIFPTTTTTTSSSSSGAVWVCADSRGRGGERHPESTSSVKASHLLHLLLTRWAPVFLCPLKTDISLRPSFLSSVSASSSPLYILYTYECRARYCTWIHIRKALASEYECWSRFFVV